MDLTEASIFEAAKESLQLAIQANVVNDIIHQGLFYYTFILHSKDHLEVGKVLKSQLIRNFVIYDWIVLQIFSTQHPLLGADFMYERKLLNLCF